MPDSTPDPALYQLAYQESLRNLTQQSAVLDNLRTRAGLVITAANVITALLGAPAIKNATTPPAGGTDIPGLSAGGILAVICFGVVGVASILILWPWKGWRFSFDVKEIVEHVEMTHPAETVGSIQRQLALANDKSYNLNEGKLRRLFLLLELAAVFLFVEAVLWVASLAHVKVMGWQL